MKRLENRLLWLKVTLNSYYGGFNNKNIDISKIYEESFLLRSKISRIKSRKSKIKNILNG